MAGVGPISGELLGVFPSTLLPSNPTPRGGVFHGWGGVETVLVYAVSN